MKAEEIYAKLEEIRALIESNSGPDGIVPIDPESVQVATEFCLMELRRGLEKAAGQGQQD